MGKNLTIVQLRVYKGQKMSYGEDMKPQNENQPVKLEHGSFQYIHFLNGLRVNGYCKVDVEKVFNVKIDDGKETISPIDDVSKYEKELADAFDKKEKKELTPDQKRIADLEKKIEEMANGGKKEPVDEKQDGNSGDDDLENVRAEYKRVFGKKPHHMAKADKLRDKIKAELDKK